MSKTFICPSTRFIHSLLNNFEGHFVPYEFFLLDKKNDDDFECKNCGSKIVSVVAPYKSQGSVTHMLTI